MDRLITRGICESASCHAKFQPRGALPVSTGCTRTAVSFKMKDH
jgi:hypothetical protein